MTIGELLENGYIKKVSVYTVTLTEDERFINIYKGTKGQLPSAVSKLTIKHWGITRGYVDINVPLQSEEEIQAFLNALAEEETWLWQRCKEKTGDEKTYCEGRRKIVRNVLRNFAKNVSTTPPDQENVIE